MGFLSNSTDIEFVENSSSTAAPTLWFESENAVEKRAKIAAYLIVFIVCLLGNCLLIAVVYKNSNQRMRTPSNYFIVNMASADLILVVYLVPVNTAMTAINYRWLIGGVTGEVLCRLHFFIGEMTVLVVTGCLFSIALDRFLLVFYPLKKIITLRIARRIIAVIWIFSIVFTSPLFFMGSLIEIRSGYVVCSFDFSILLLVIMYFLFCFIPIILIPLVIIVILYIAIGVKIKRTIPPGNQLPSNQEQRERMTHKVLAMLGAVVAAVILFRFPLLIGLIVCFSGLTDICHGHNYLFVTFFLTFTNSAINPLIYFIFNNQFRHGARLVLERIIPCCFKTTNEVDVIHSSAQQMVRPRQQQLDDTINHKPVENLILTEI